MRAQKPKAASRWQPAEDLILAFSDADAKERGGPYRFVLSFPEEEISPGKRIVLQSEDAHVLARPLGLIIDEGSAEGIRVTRIEVSRMVIGLMNDEGGVPARAFTCGLCTACGEKRSTGIFGNEDWPRVFPGMAVRLSLHNHGAEIVRFRGAVVVEACDGKMIVGPL